MWSRRSKAVRANAVNNADTERDRATPVQDIDMYVCMYVCVFVFVHRHTHTHIHTQCLCCTHTYTHIHTQ